MSNRLAPSPISSSGVKAMHSLPWGRPFSSTVSTAVMISATPALSSAPSRVVPSVVIRVSPFIEVRKGKAETFITMPVAGRVTSLPS